MTRHPTASATLSPARVGPWLAGFALLIAAAAMSVAPARAAEIRLKLHPLAAARGQLPDARLAKLEAAAGAKLTLSGTTRTGALEFTVAGDPDAAAVSALLGRLRVDRAVLWAEPIDRSTATKRALRARRTTLGNRLLVRLADGVAADWPSLLPTLSQRAGTPLAAVRQIGEVWVLETMQAQAELALARIAESIQGVPAIQYADPVLRKHANAVPNDPLFPNQWGLHDPLSGINASAAWDRTTGAPGMVVAVIDTGIVPHPDLAGRVLPGYDFISDAGEARDSDARDPNPLDQGDWLGDGDCGGYAAQPSSWHGTFVAGQIAANADNGVGIAGVDWQASILPVRTLGQCGGTDEDVFEGMMWASGVQISGVPANPNPAKVINMSLGGWGGCSQAIQDAIDDALAQGAVVVVDAGNETDNVAGYSPANCSGVITVAAHNRKGERAFYSNFGRRIDLSAPAGDGDTDDDAIVSTSNDGATEPGSPTYHYGIGTSFAAPQVAGTASLMLARNPTLTPGRILGILQGTSREFPSATVCRTSGLCGTGMLDAGQALAATPPANANPPAGAVAVIEYYNPTLDHYFITASPVEIANLDTAPAGSFQRTGYFFYAYPDLASAPAGAQPVCRFYAGGNTLINSHYFSANPAECAYVQSRWQGTWLLEQYDAFYVLLPSAAGTCPDTTMPVHRFFNNRRDANHRYTIDLSVKRAMVNRAWVPEGNGPGAVAFCSPI
jgi:serine protease